MEVKTVIKRHILDEILQRSDLHINDDTPLIDDGYITSLQAVEIVMFLEDQFQIVVDPEEVSEEEFHSLDTITQLVERKIE